MPLRNSLPRSCADSSRFLTPICRLANFGAMTRHMPSRILPTKEACHCLSAGSAETFLSRFRDTCLKNKARLTCRFFRSILHGGGNPRRTSASLFPLSSFRISSLVSKLRGKCGELRIKGNGVIIPSLSPSLHALSTFERYLVKIVRRTQRLPVTDNIFPLCRAAQGSSGSPSPQNTRRRLVHVPTIRVDRAHSRRVTRRRT